MSTQRRKFSDQIRSAVDASGMTRYRICKRLGLAEATMSRFMTGKGGLSMRKLDQLADLLGLTVTVQRRENEE